MDQLQPCEHEDDAADGQNAATVEVDSEHMPAPSRPTETMDAQDIEMQVPSKIVAVSSLEGHETPELKINQEGANKKEVEVEAETAPQHIPLLRSNLSGNAKSLSLPKVNCQEKIILCVDNSLSMFTSHFKRTVQSIKQTSVFHILVGALKQFIMTKAFINKKHEFSFLVLDGEAQLIVTQFASQGAEVVYKLQEILDNRQTTDEPEQTQDFDLSGLFDLISTLVQPLLKHPQQLPPPFLVRVILVYGRSHGTLAFRNGKESYEKLCQNPYFFTDCLYVHDEPHEKNNVTDIFSCLCDLDRNSSSYVLEVSVDGSMSSLYNAFAKLCAHPLQRQRQPLNQDFNVFSAD